MKVRAAVLIVIVSLVFGVYAIAEDKGEQGTAQKKELKTEQKSMELKTEMDKVSYSIGTNIGEQFKQQEIEIRMDAFIAGLTDAMKGKEYALDKEEMQTVMQKFQKEMQAKMRAKAELAREKNAKEGAEFLAANKDKDGVVTLDSGLQYKVLRKGTGASPKASDRVKTHYRGTLINGKEFDSSYKRGMPAEFGVGGVIKGWTEALQLMKEGSKWELYIPSELAYGTRDSRDIPANSTLIFEVELIEVIKK